VTPKKKNENRQQARNGN